GLAAELLPADERVRLAEQRALPLAGLRRVVLPGDLRVVRRVVTAVADGLADRVLDALDEAAVDGQTEEGGQVTFGDAVGRIDGPRVAELGDDVAVAKDEAVDGRPRLGDRAERPAEGRLLGGEVL